MHTLPNSIKGNTRVSFYLKGCLSLGMHIMMQVEKWTEIGREEITQSVIAALPVNPSKEELSWFIKHELRKIVSTEDWLVLRKQIRRRAIEEKQKAWDEVLPSHIVRWATETLREEAKGQEYVDNYRVAQCGKSSQKRRYRKQQSTGCCGSRDFIRVGPDGNKYMLGYNYGH